MEEARNRLHHLHNPIHPIGNGEVGGIIHIGTIQMMMGRIQRIGVRDGDVKKKEKKTATERESMTLAQNRAKKDGHLRLQR